MCKLIEVGVLMKQNNKNLDGESFKPVHEICLWQFLHLSSWKEARPLSVNGSKNTWREIVGRVRCHFPFWNNTKDLTWAKWQRQNMKNINEKHNTNTLEKSWKIFWNYLTGNCVHICCASNFPFETIEEALRTIWNIKKQVHAKNSINVKYLIKFWIIVWNAKKQSH